MWEVFIDFIYDVHLGVIKRLTESQLKQLSSRFCVGPDTSNTASILVHDKERITIHEATCHNLHRVLLTQSEDHCACFPERETKQLGNARSSVHIIRPREHGALRLKPHHVHGELILGTCSRCGFSTLVPDNLKLLKVRKPFSNRR